MTNQCRYFFGSNFVGVIPLFVLFFLNQNSDMKRYNALRYHIPKGIIKNYNTMEKIPLANPLILIQNNMKKYES